MTQAEPGAGSGAPRITLLPMFESFIPVPVTTELAPREGWAAFVAAMRDRDPAPPADSLVDRPAHR
jgi:hypothetical protein